MKQFFTITLITLAMALSLGCSSDKRDQEAEQPLIVQPLEPQAHPTPRKNLTKKPEKRALRVPSEPKVFKPAVPGRRVARVNVPGKYVALTFDDGPSASYTPKVLDILRRHGAHATFFVLGENAACNKAILARAAAEGHEIASHTWDHANLTKLSHEQIASQMDRTAAVVQEATGRNPALMRPPYGATNRDIVDYMMTQYGMPSVLWDVDTVDWKHPGIGVVIDRAVNQAHNGSIILLHDIHGSTLQAVEGVVSGLQARGFQLVTVSQLIRMGRSAAGAAPDAPAPPAVANTLPPSDEGGSTPSQPADQQPAPPASPEQPAPPAPTATPLPEPQQAVANSIAPQEPEMGAAPQPTDSQIPPAAYPLDAAIESDDVPDQQNQPDVQ